MEWNFSESFSANFQQFPRSFLLVPRESLGLRGNAPCPSRRAMGNGRPSKATACCEKVAEESVFAGEAES